MKMGTVPFVFLDLFHPVKLRDLQRAFEAFVQEQDALLYKKYVAYLSEQGLSPLEEDFLLIETASYVNRFISQLFSIEAETEQRRKHYLRENAVTVFKNRFVKRWVLPKKRKAEALKSWESLKISVETLFSFFEIAHSEGDEEMSLCRLSERLLKDVTHSCYTFIQERPQSRSKLLSFLGLESSSSDGDLYRNALDRMADYVYYLLCKQEKLPREQRWASLDFPSPTVFDELLKIKREEDGLLLAEDSYLEIRDGFKWVNHPHSLRKIAGEIDYCLKCFSRSKDSCSKGFRTSQGDVTTNPLGEKMSGCPLNEKIGQFHTLAGMGNFIGALAMIMVDNPMCPGTGDRICNDCERSCIYVQQDSVGVPKTETAVLREVVYELPYGFEIYGLLTRWNPLKRNPAMLEYNGKNVLVVGMGPAGYTLAHYLSNEGVFVLGIDSLKIEPLPPDFFDKDGNPLPVRDFGKLLKPLDQRAVLGFGGVCEYGITVRWDKNFLLLMMATLLRKPLFRLHSGIHFGGNLPIEEAFSLGFHHIAMASGSGKPHFISAPGNLAGGVRKASDFLMTLQSNGVFKKDALASLELRLPSVVIGGGLTAIDTATEVFAYYPLFVEKIYHRVQCLKKEGLLASLQENLSLRDKENLSLYLKHGEIVAQTREKSEKQGLIPDFKPLVKEWGGVKVLYRKTIQESPAYRLNSGELQKALGEGIAFMENTSLEHIETDENGFVKSIRVKIQGIPPENNFSEKWMEVKSLFVAAGTQANNLYEKEFKGSFTLDEKGHYYVPHTLENSGEMTTGSGFFTSYAQGEKRISYFGDLHPHYGGSVVKAMSSAKKGYPHILEHLQSHSPSSTPLEVFIRGLDEALEARVTAIRRLAPNIVELEVKSPLAARHFQPGQFYKIQNFEATAPRRKSVPLFTEPIALTAAAVDKEKGSLTFVVLEVGHSTRLLSQLKVDEKILCMGPTGMPTVIPQGESILLIGGGLGNAVLLSVAKACYENGNRVLYFGGYRRASDVVKTQQLAPYCEQLILCCDELGSPHFTGGVLEALRAYHRGEIENRLALESLTHLIVVGSEGLMKSTQTFVRENAALFPNLKHSVASVNSPMQCMSKGICAQCVQRHYDSEKGKEKWVFSCFKQDQKLSHIDFDHLKTRLSQNSLSEKVNDFYLKTLL